MKFRHSIPGLFLLLFLNVSSRGQDTILLFHPTAYNMEVIQKLYEEDLLELEGYHVLGVYHTNEPYDYGMAQAYLAQTGKSMFSLQEIKEELGPENIFRKNPASDKFRELFEHSRGALFMGGPDIPPVVYGEDIHLLTSVTDPFRHYLELSYLFHLLGGSQNAAWIPYMDANPDYVISGICLGMQTMHVATGGSMVQDIPTELYGIWQAEAILALPGDQMHRNYMDYLSTTCEDPTSYHFHHIELKPDMILSSGIGFAADVTPLVLSSHHQAIDAPGPEWEVAARSMDGKIIEAIQHRRYPNVLGIQFHPEKPGLFDPSLRHSNNCNSSINFQESIKGTDSYAFHLAYWKYLAQILNQNRLAPN